MRVFKTKELPEYREPSPGSRLVTPIFDKNDIPASPVSMNFVRLKKGGKVLEHIHNNGIEAILVLEGRCSAKVGDETRELVVDDLLYVPQNIKHETWNDHDEPVRLLCVFGPSIDYSTIRDVWYKE